MSREPVTIESMVEHIDGFSDLVDKVDHTWRKSHALKRVVAGDRARAQVELKAVDGQLATPYDCVTSLFESFKALRGGASADAAARRRISDLLDSSVEVTSMIVKARNSLHALERSIEQTPSEVDAALKPGEGIAMILDGELISVSFCQLSLWLGLRNDLPPKPDQMPEEEK